MDDVPAVQRAERTKNAERRGDGFVRLERTVFQTARERLAAQELHHDEELIVGLADVVDLADAWMADAGSGSRFTPETRLGLAVRGQRADDFDGDFALESGIERTIHVAHSARTKTGDDFVLPQASSASQQHPGRNYTGASGQ